MSRLPVSGLHPGFAICLLPNFWPVIFIVLCESQFPNLENGEKNMCHKDSRDPCKYFSELISSHFPPHPCLPRYSSTPSAALAEPAQAAPSSWNVLPPEITRLDSCLGSGQGSAQMSPPWRGYHFHPLTDVIPTPEATLLHHPGYFFHNTYH